MSAATSCWPGTRAWLEAYHRTGPGSRTKSWRLCLDHYSWNRKKISKPCYLKPNSRPKDTAWTLIAPRWLSWKHERSWKNSYDRTYQTQHHSNRGTQGIQDV